MLGAWKFLAHSKDIHKTLKSHELSHSMLTGYLWNHSRDVGINLLLKKFGRMWNVSADRNILPSFDVWRFLTKSLTANPGNGQVLLSSCFGCQRRTTTRLLWLSLLRLASKSGFRNREFCILSIASHIFRFACSRQAAALADIEQSVSFLDSNDIVTPFDRRTFEADLVESSKYPFSGESC